MPGVAAAGAAAAGTAIVDPAIDGEAGVATVAGAGVAGLAGAADAAPAAGEDALEVAGAASAVFAAGAAGAPGSFAASATTDGAKSMERAPTKDMVRLRRFVVEFSITISNLQSSLQAVLFVATKSRTILTDDG